MDLYAQGIDQQIGLQFCWLGKIVQFLPVLKHPDTIPQRYKVMPIVHAFERKQFQNRKVEKRQPDRLIKCDCASQWETDRSWH